MKSEQIARPIRSYVRRAGHITPGQERALQQDWPQFRLALPASSEQPIDVQAQFQRHVPRILEIGFGMGDVLLTAAENNPDKDYVGIEVHPPGIGRCLLKAHLANLSNIKVCQADVMQVLPRFLANSFDQVWVFFPDPWPKTRHHKRRLIQPSFVLEIARILQPSGSFHLATDWQPYADHMMEVLEACPALTNRHGLNTFAPQADVARPKSKFQRRGEQMGYSISDLCFDKR